QKCCEKMDLQLAATDDTSTQKEGCVFKTVFEGEYPDTGFLVHSPGNVKPAIEKALKWMVKEQLKDGSWSAGTWAGASRNNNTQVQGDPATTALVAMSILRCGISPLYGEYAQEMKKATEYLLKAVESAPEKSTTITTLVQTQPQVKLGANIDV